jgi:hypothetical protein
MGSVTNNAMRVRIGYRDLFAMAIYSFNTGYDYSELYSTGDFSDPTDGTALH